MIMKKQSGGYREILRQTQFMKLVAANVVNRLGDALDAVAYTWIVYQVTGSASWAALIFGLNQLPTILLLPVAGALVERRNKKRVMVVTDVVRGLITLGFCLMYMAGLLNGWIIALFTLTISSVEAFRVPCGKSVLPQLLAEAHYTYGTSVNSALSTVAELAGTGLAGVVIALWGAQVAVLGDVITFFLSALILATMRVNPPKVAAERSEPFFRTLSQGFRYVVSRHTIRNLALVAVLINACAVPLNSFFAVIVQDVWRQGAELMSAAEVALTVGALLGSVAYPLVAARMGMQKLLPLFGSVMALTFVGVAALGNVSSAAVIWAGALTCFLLLGVCSAICNSGLGVEFMKVVAPEYLSRASAILGAMSTAAVPVMSFALSAACRVVSVEALLISGGVLFMIVMGLVVVFHIPLEEPRMERDDDEHDGETRDQLDSGSDEPVGERLFE